jgi:hypothetical protein
MEFLDLTKDSSILLQAIPVLDISVHCEHPEMEFLDINFTNSSLLSHSLLLAAFYRKAFVEKKKKSVEN